MKEFKVNEYITLKLEYNETVIYVAGRMFNQCKYLFINIPIDKVSEYDDINSIDEAAEVNKLNNALEAGIRIHNDIQISPETEFWGHCSNLQVWVEHDYDTRLLHSNLSFPLLKRLTEVGDPLAKKVFKDEIALRFEKGNNTVRNFLIESKYLNYLNKEELELLLLNLREEYKEELLDHRFLDYFITLFVEDPSILRSKDFLAEIFFYSFKNFNDIIGYFPINKQFTWFQSKLIFQIQKITTTLRTIRVLSSSDRNKLKKERQTIFLKLINNLIKKRG
jgi:hypothetical protein